MMPIFISVISDALARNQLKELQLEIPNTQMAKFSGNVYGYIFWRNG
jgi:hypothetical protein